MSARQSPARRAWRRFRSNRLGYVSLLVFAVLFGVSLIAELVSNDKPLVARYNGHWTFPVIETTPETAFGGDFPTPTDFLDPRVRENLAQQAGRGDQAARVEGWRFAGGLR